jgi:hypothetical protein
MSVLLGLRFGDSAILATDSRIIDNTGTYVLSDSEPKLAEIAPGAFYGWSGYRLLAGPQVETAESLARTADMRDLRAFADRVDEASKPLTAQLLSTLAAIRDQNPTKYGEELAGTKPFHAYVLAGLSNGTPGFLAREYWFINGEVMHRETDGFSLPPGNDFAMYVTYGEALADVVPKPETWAQGPVAAVDGFVDIIRRAQPLAVGGPTQLVCVDKSGARWVHRPAAPHPASLDCVMSLSPLATGKVRLDCVMPLSHLATGILPVGVIYAGTLSASNITGGTISAAVSMTAPSLAITSGGTTITLNATDQIKISKSGYVSQLGTSFVTSFGASDGLYVSGASGTQVTVVESANIFIGGSSGTGGPYFGANAGGFGVTNGSLSAGAVPGEIVVSGVSSGASAFLVNGSQVLSTRVTATPITLADVIAVLQHHGLSN